MDVSRRRLLIVGEHLLSPARGHRPGCSRPATARPRSDPARLDALQIALLTCERDLQRVELGKAQLVIEAQEEVTAPLDLLAGDDQRGNT